VDKDHWDNVLKNEEGVLLVRTIMPLVLLVRLSVIRPAWATENVANGPSKLSKSRNRLLSVFSDKRLARLLLAAAPRGISGRNRGPSSDRRRI
jgi:hypothetical protein